jgi:hypothetical protein
MVGQALVLFVFILSIKWGIWETLPEDSLLGIAFVLAFLWTDEPIVKIMTVIKTLKEEEKK